MALVTVVGYPSSGKSTRAHELKTALDARQAAPDYTGEHYRVVIVSDESSHVPREAYDSSQAEKPARANLFSAVQRELGKDAIVICDSANYIKGFRYQLYCAAREAHCRVCTIHVAVPPDVCKARHEARPAPEQYKAETFDNLIMRFEEPSSMVRWDSPLFTLASDEAMPVDALWHAITTGALKGPTAAAAARPPQAANTLHTLTATTSAITAALLAHLGAMPTATSFVVPSPPAPAPAAAGVQRTGAGRLELRLPVRRVTMPEMQRLKRQYEAVQTKAQQSGGRAKGNWTEEEVASGFVAFLETTWGLRD